MRDDFSESTKTAIARRVGYHCSNPDCRALTSGPSTNPVKAINIGVAAHITGASQGGPRYDPTITPDERRHANNAIWLCQTCAKLIDNDEERFPVEILRTWKRHTEQGALLRIGKTLTPESIKTEEIWELIKKYYPREVAYQLLADSLTSINSFHPDYSVSASMKDGVTTLLIDKLNDNAPQMTVYFKPIFPDTPEGLKKRQEYNCFLKDGSPVDLDQSNVPYEQLPDVMKKILPSLDSYHICLGTSKNQRTMKMDLIVLSETGENFKFHALDLKIIRSGREEITFSNEDQNIPFHIEIQMKKSLHANVTWNFNVVGQNTYWLLQSIRFQKIGSTCKQLVLRDTMTGIEYNMGLTDYMCEQEPPKEFEEIVQKLFLIQNKTRTPIRIPERDFTNADFNRIEWIEAILKTGNQLSPPSNFRVTINPATKGFEFLASLLDKPGQSFSVTLPMHYERILDTDIPLGPVDLSSSSIKIHPEDIDNCRRFFREERKEQSISVRLVASPGHIINTCYPYWSKPSVNS